MRRTIRTRMAIPLKKLSVVIISVFLVFFASLSHPLMPNRCPSYESQALLRLKAASNGSIDSVNSWVNGTDCCSSWDGISCDDHANHVVSIEVGYSSTTEGVISESLCELRFLTSLTISGVSGIIPPCLGNLSYIHSLVLSGNSFSGTIPPSLCLLTRLTYLEISENNLNGSIPSCLGNVSFLSYLYLRDNQLSGSIPASLGSLSLLRELDLGDNQLSGNMPDSLGNLSLLQWLDISYNQVGPFPLHLLSFPPSLAWTVMAIVSTKPSLLPHFHLLYLIYAFH